MRLTAPRDNAENAELQRELFNTLNDSINPVVEEVVALIDTQNPDLRKELFMSVVNEEAENIVQEAIENGVAAPLDAPQTEGADPVASAKVQPTPPAATEPVEAVVEAASDGVPADELSLEESLALAQEELAKAVESVQADEIAERAQDETPDAVIEPVANTTMEPVTATVESLGATPDEADVSDLQSNDVASDIEAQLDACLTAEAEATPAAPIAADVMSDASGAAAASSIEEPVIEVAATEPETSTNTGSPFEEYTADKATAAVEEIERGIRKLADVLNNDVSTQWKQAQDAFGEVMEARTKAGALHKEATQMTREISRLKEEIEIARDDADVARRETKLMREDAMQAKRRAEDLADAAQNCVSDM